MAGWAVSRTSRGIEPTPFWAHPWRRLGVILMGLGAMLFLLTAAYATWLCEDSVYNCPAGGCGPVPAQNCNHAEGGAFAAGIVAAIVVVFGALLFPAARSGRPLWP